MSKLDTLGLIATYKNGIRSLQETGQADRLVRSYFGAYAQRFNRIYYFSYLDEKLEDYTQDPLILDKVRLLPKRWDLPDFLYGLLLPWAYPKEFKECGAFRVFQSIGILPLVWPFFRTNSLVTYGYRYAQLSRVEKKSAWKTFGIWCLERLAFGRATCMLATTKPLYDHVHRQRPDKSLVFIPNAVDVDVFYSPLSRSRGNKKEKTILFVGRFAPQKNLKTLVEAAGLVAKEEKIKLLCVGRGELEDDLRSWARASSVPLEVRPPVPHQELAQLMRDADVFFLPSWLEGNPKVLLEAMSSGLPCVVSDIEAHRALVQDGVTALLFPPQDPRAAAENLKIALTHTTLAEKMGSLARKQIVDQFNLNRLLSQETEILVRLATTGRLRRTPPARGSWLSRWLDRSVRRKFLDQDLQAVAPFLTGDVLEVGGGKNVQRGHFERPWWQVRSWATLNKDPQALPDQCGDAEDLPYPDESFDSVCCLEVLEYIPRPDQALKEMRRVLKSGGTLVLSVPQVHWLDHPEDKWRFSRRELQSLLWAAALSPSLIIAQGGTLSGWAHLAMTFVRRLSHRWVRFGAALVVAPLVEILIRLDKTARLLQLWQSKSTGYLAVANKERKLESFRYDEAVRRKMIVYYTKYYRETLGLPDWEKRVQGRLQEEKQEEDFFRVSTKTLERLEGKSFLNVGCGTGGINIVAHDHGMRSFGVEISREALDICRLKAAAAGIPESNFVEGVAEELPFPDNSFDLVHCHSVIEHVQDVKKSLHEMVRVLKPGGVLYLNAPNYITFYEGHYKIFWLPKMPKFLGRRYLRWRKRPASFLNSLNYVTPGSLRRAFAGLPVHIEQGRWTKTDRTSRSTALTYSLYTLMGITPAEFWVSKLRTKDLSPHSSERENASSLVTAPGSR